MPVYHKRTPYRLPPLRRCSECDWLKRREEFGETKTGRATKVCNACAPEFEEFRKETQRIKNRYYVGKSQKKLLGTPEGRIANRLRVRISLLLNSNNVPKKGSAVRDLGCTPAALRQHLEAQWADGMSWDNYGLGRGKWSIDHIIPLSAFNLQDRQHFLLASNHLNLRPMWHVENSRKNDSIELPWAN